MKYRHFKGRFYTGSILSIAIVCLPKISLTGEAPLSFFQGVEAIVNRHIPLSIQRALSEQVSARDQAVRGAFIPSLAINGEQTTKAFEGSNRLTSRSGEAVISYNLFRFGADLAAWRAANEDEVGAQAQVDQARLNAEQEAVEALARQIERTREAEILEQIVATRIRSETIARERFRRGLLPLQEADRTTIDLQNAQAQLRDAQLNLIRSRSELVVLLGHSNVQMDWPWIELFNSPALLLNQSPIEMIEKRPDWKAARHALEAESERVLQRSRQRLPSLDGNLTYGYYSDTHTTGNWGWSGTIGLSIPVFSQFQDQARYRAEIFSREMSELNLNQVERRALAEQDASHQLFITALETAKAREKTIAIAQALYQDNLKRFQAGHLSANDLILDQNRLYNSKQLASQGWSQAHIAASLACHSLGMKLSECLKP